ncbi:MAG: hypothetical protein CMH54_01980 [Myxococcales bacterium]|nr:hypothetical protein [Myxococcales bacterium]
MRRSTLFLVFLFLACASEGDTVPILPSADNGTTQFDPGTGAMDQGTTQFDPGTGSMDQGSSQVDQGTTPVDQGGGQVDTGGSVVSNPSGQWMLTANPSSQEFCSNMQTFDAQVLVLSVTGDGHATATLAPPGWAITLNFDGTLAGTKLTMVAEYTEAGPPSIGWATEHTHTIDVTISSTLNFAGSYVHELVPNDASPCTRYWNISGSRL